MKNTYIYDCRNVVQQNYANLYVTALRFVLSWFITHDLQPNNLGSVLLLLPNNQLVTLQLVRYLNTTLLLVRFTN